MQNKEKEEIEQLQHEVDQLKQKYLDENERLIQLNQQIKFHKLMASIQIFVIIMIIFALSAYR